MPGTSTSARATSSAPGSPAQSQFEDPGAARPVRPRKAAARVRERLDPALPCREVRRLPAQGPGGEDRGAQLAVLADGFGPFLGGGFGHFYMYAPVKIEYAIDRYAMEAKRQFDVLDRHFADHRFAAGDEYSIADMAIWPWYGSVALGQPYWRCRDLPVDQRLQAFQPLGRGSGRGRQSSAGGGSAARWRMTRPSSANGIARPI